MSFFNHLSDFNNVATPILTAGLLVVAILALCATWGTLKAAKESSIAAREANEQAKRDSIAQTRPYVYAEILPGLAGHMHFDLRIRNVGRSPARNLKLYFDSWPENPDDVAEQIRILFETPRTLPPGVSIRAMWRLQGNFTNGTDKAGMPCSGKIRVSYSSDDESSPSYEDEYDVLIYESGYWPVPEDGPDAKIDPSRRDFYKMGQAIARSIGNISR